MNICTIIAKNYLAHARVLAASFQRLHPEGRCHVLVIDETEGYVDAAAEDFVLVRPDEIGLEDFDQMRGAYDVMELSTAVKPWLLRHMLRHHDDGSGIAYFDPDIQVISRMVELEAALQESAVVLTPHVLQGMPRDGKKPSETDILMAGVYNLGFIGLSNRDDAHLMLDWWSERLLTDCHVAPERGLFVDQRWVDFVPGLISDLQILRRPGYNVAYWNLAERRLDRQDSVLLANGEELRFFHFSGYSPDRRLQVSKHQDRIEFGGDPLLMEIFDTYGDALVEAGYADVKALPYEHAVLPSGLRLTKEMRALYRAGLEVGQCGGSIFTPAGEAEYFRYLNERAADAPDLSRFLYGVWLSRPDLQRTYPDVERGDIDGFVGWCYVHGRGEIGIPDALLPLERPSVEGTPAAAEPSRSPAVRRPPLGVNVAGYLRSELGIGEVARQIVGALDAADVPALPVGLTAADSRQGHGYAAVGHDQNPFPVNIVCVNADGLPAFARDAGEEFFTDRYTVGVWWWETSEFPESFHGAFDLVDEVWVGSHFVAQTVAASSPVPVVHVPIPVQFAESPPLRPGEYGWPNAFTFLFSWDYCSVFARKNPLAVIEAYTSAFDEGAGTALVLKCINPDFDPVAHRKVKAAIADRRDIVLIDSYLDPADKDRLMSSCDCYVSLHRSEGLGLTMAEAMFHGKPVVATAYSGNVDFMTAGNSYAVGFDLVPIGEGAAPYGPEGTWAEPDVAEASRLMRAVFEDREEAARRGARAAADMREHFSAAAAGEKMRARLAAITARRSSPDLPVSPTVEAAAAVVRRGAATPGPSRQGKAGTAARKAAKRGARLFSGYQQQVNEALARALRTLDAEAAAAAAHTNTMAEEWHARTLAQLRAQQAQIATLTAAVTHERLARQDAVSAAERLVAEARALPYMSREAFRISVVPGAGAVYGYDAPAAIDDRDRYREFEELFRGDEAFIADRQRRYLDVIGDCAPVVDVGCGRGEFLDVLAEAGIDATGVDADAGMVERCRAKGHAQTVLGDGVTYLEGLEDASLGLVFSAQVVEHMPPDALRHFLAVAARKLRPGGLLVAETVNPHSAAALKAFWVDITHQHPLFPETMLALSRFAGFASAFVFHPNGTGNVEVDRYTTGEYALVAGRGRRRGSLRTAACRRPARASAPGRPAR